MSAEPSLLTMDTSAFQETVGQMVAGHDRLENFLRGLFGDLDAFVDEVVRHDRSVDSAKRDHDTLCSEREQRLGRERQELESTIERLEELTGQLGASAVASSGDSEQLREVFASIQEERSTFQNALVASESHGAELARMADELGATRQDLADAREEIRAQRELLGQIPLPSQSRVDQEMQDRLGQIEQERSAWVQERAVLETELDAVRVRAAELADTLDEERQRASGERKDWAEELRQMRQVLQSLSEAKMTAVPNVAAPVAVPVEPAEQADVQDPVLDSVMAQFEILQKDLARRRKSKPASKS